MARRTRDRIEEQLAALSTVRQQPNSDAAHVLLREGLRAGKGPLVARSAALIRELHLEGFEGELADAFLRLLDGGADADPGCLAKVAVLEALDFGETLDPAPFLRAIRVVQQEPGFGDPEDSGSGVRARGALALARLHHRDILLLLAELLADPEALVREAAADALVHHGDPAGAGLALLRLEIGDAEPPVILACMSALIALAPESGLERVAGWLEGEDRNRSELAALALGESRLEAAADRLIAAISQGIGPGQRRGPLLALAVHRSERALTAILGIVSHGALPDAKAAVEALRPREGERAVRDGLKLAIERSRFVDELRHLRGDARFQ